MKKKILAALLVTAIAIAGCSGGASTGGNATASQAPASSAPATTAATAEPATSEPATSAPATTDSAAPVELTVWESNQGPDEFIQQAGDAFTQLHPNITIKYVHVELGDSTTQIALDGPSGVGPDLFAAPHDQLGTLVSAGNILEVTTDKDAVSNQLLPGCLKAVTYNGKMWGYPVSTETYSLFYNKDLCPDPPKTWDDLITFAQNFNSANPGKYGFVMDVGNIYYTILFMSSNNNMLFGPDGTDAANTMMNTPSAVQGMQEFYKLKQIQPAAASDLATSTVDALFQSGQAALHITGPWNFKNFKDAGINFGVTTLPSLPGNNTPALSFSGTRCMFVSAYTNHPEEAAMFGEFLISSDMQKLRYDITGALPSVSIAVGGDYGDYANGMLQQMNYAYPMPSIPQMGKFWDAGNAASANIWNGDGSNIQSELDACNAAILAE